MVTELLFVQQLLIALGILNGGQHVGMLASSFTVWGQVLSVAAIFLGFLNLASFFITRILRFLIRRWIA